MDRDIRKQVMRLFTYGLYVLTVRHEEELAASTVTWVSQASFEPLRITVAVNADGQAHALLVKSGKFALNLVGAGQKELAVAFFKAPRMAEGHLSGFTFHDGDETGAPIFDDAPAWLEAEVCGTVEGGDHTVFAADVLDLGIADEAATALALADTPWHYGH